MSGRHRNQRHIHNGVRPVLTTSPALDRVHPILILQRAAGNRAVTRLLTGDVQLPVLQRHASWEHVMMGDTKARDAAQAVRKVDPKMRRHVLEEERDRANYFKENPFAVPDQSNPLFIDVQLLQLERSKLWVTYGEVSALADYFPNPQAIYASSADQIIPMLQYMRKEITKNCDQVLKTGEVDANDTDVSGGGFKGAQPSTPLENKLALHASPAAATIKVEDDATASQGFQSYSGLLTRNACHFAPFNWARYILHHNDALREAVAAHSAKLTLDSKTATTEARQAAQQRVTKAWVINAYADHFLEDSFSAGHLVNKTLVMQWFLEYCAVRKDAGASISASIPGRELANTMDTRHQKNIAGQGLYGGMEAGTLGSKPLPQVDPQTASEIPFGSVITKGEAVGLDASLGRPPTDTGTKLRVAEDYQSFLRSMYLQTATALAHNQFGSTAGPLTVLNRKGEKFVIGGDDKQLNFSNEAGERIVIEAVNASRKAVDDAINTGVAAEGVTQDIIDRVPSRVMVGSKDVPLDEWNDTVVRDYCWGELFGKIWDSHATDIGRKIAPQLDTTPDPSWTSYKIW